MIWMWIVAAVAISWLFCRKKVAWYHYIWMLLPIEMYGVNIAGAMLKPYMIFGLLIIITCFTKGKGTRIPIGIFFCAFALMVSDILNGLVTASIMQHVMFLFILYTAYSYVLLAQEDEEFLDSMREVTVATTIGYGLVFAIAYTLYILRPDIPGVYTTDRYSTGMVLRFLSTGGASIVRFRGFCIDPNSVVTTLIPGMAFSLQYLIYEKKNIVKNSLAVLLYVVVMITSGSRMALICTLLMAVIMLLAGYKLAENKGRWVLLLMLLTLGGTIIGTLRFQTIANSLSEFMGSRAGLNDKAGRVTIWKYNISWLANNGRLLIGVGQNQIFKLTGMGKECHNTWLEWICGTGILIGGGIICWFISAPLRFARRTKQLGLTQYMSLLFAYVTTAVCITTVDNITNSVLIFLMIVFNYGNITSSKSVKSKGGK